MTRLGTQRIHPTVTLQEYNVEQGTFMLYIIYSSGSVLTIGLSSCFNALLIACLSHIIIHYVAGGG